MKKFTDSTKSTKSKLEIQPDSINYISEEDLDKYLKIAGKFIMDETKEIVNWLKINNDSYLHDLDPDADADNALAAFYNAGVPKDEKLKHLYTLVGKVVKADRIIEIPVFQTKEQFNGIIDKKVSPDEVLLDLTSEKGRTKIVNQYQPLIHKIINQFMGKSSLPREELYSCALFGLVYAMNHFGKPKKRENGKWVDDEKSEKHAGTTFGQFAAYHIRQTILWNIEDNSRTVRTPKSAQKRERDEVGYNVKNNTVSGNKTVGHDSEGNGKTLFDYIENVENAGKSLNNEDLMKLWNAAYAKLDEKFGKEAMELFYRCYKINGYEDEKKNQKEIAAEYNLKPSTLNVRLHKIIDYIKKDKNMLSMFTQILELAHECMQDKYNEEDQLTEAKNVPSNINLNED